MTCQTIPTDVLVDDVGVNVVFCVVISIVVVVGVMDGPSDIKIE